jgi:hypothetical protein
MPTARTLKVQPIYRPQVSGEEKLIGAHAHAATPVGVRARVDMYDDGSEVRWWEFLESDHAGIVAEWQAGTATTIVEAAITAALAADSHTSPYSSAQRTNLVRNDEAYT